MTVRLVVAGTDTDVGKTVFSAALVAALDAIYWKPVQCGLDGGTDTLTVQSLSGQDPACLLEEAYKLALPASPHVAAERESIEIDVDRLTLPDTGARPLIIELAGGLLVPLTRRSLQIDIVARWGVPVVLCASTRLGTINHSLLSIEALKDRAIPVAGIAFIGEENADSQRTIVEMGGVRSLGRLPHIEPLNAATLRAAFDVHFQRDDFLAGEKL